MLFFDQLRRRGLSPCRGNQQQRQGSTDSESEEAYGEHFRSAYLSKLNGMSINWQPHHLIGGGGGMGYGPYERRTRERITHTRKINSAIGMSINPMGNSTRSFPTWPFSC